VRSKLCVRACPWRVGLSPSLNRRLACGGTWRHVRGSRVGSALVHGDGFGIRVTRHMLRVEGGMCIDRVSPLDRESASNSRLGRGSCGGRVSYICASTYQFVRRINMRFFSSGLAVKRVSESMSAIDNARSMRPPAPQQRRPRRRYARRPAGAHLHLPMVGVGNPVAVLSLVRQGVERGSKSVIHAINDNRR
jgi:hypothetical protein